MDAEEKVGTIEDIIVNHYGEEDEPLTKKELRRILDAIVDVLESK
jgi:hypothetical protein